jgi:hypothetical protein
MEPKPGDKFGDRYQLLSKLGEGGHGRGLRGVDLFRKVLIYLAPQVGFEPTTLRLTVQVATISAMLPIDRSCSESSSCGPVTK